MTVEPEDIAAVSWYTYLTIALSRVYLDILPRPTLEDPSSSWQSLRRVCWNDSELYYTILR
jgi:hypothetical protein